MSTVVEQTPRRRVPPLSRRLPTCSTPRNPRKLRTRLWCRRPARAEAGYGPRSGQQGRCDSPADAKQNLWRRLKEDGSLTRKTSS